MDATILYLFKSSLVFTVLIGFYYVCLRKESFHTLKRFFLLSIPFVALLFPYINIPILSIEGPLSVKVTKLFPTGIEMESSTVFQTGSLIDTNPLLFALLAVSTGVSLVLIMRIIIGLRTITLKIRRATKIPLSIGILAKSLEKLNPFSFFRFIVLNPNLHDKNELESIIRHEQGHVYQIHSLDILLAQIICIINWFNPFSWLYKNMIIENLEYLADAYALRNIQDKRNYQLSLIRSGNKFQSFRYTNSFNNKLIKNRIMMMNNHPSSQFDLIRFVLVIPLICAMAIAMGQVIPIKHSLSENEMIQTIYLDHIEASLLEGKELFMDDQKAELKVILKKYSKDGNIVQTPCAMEIIRYNQSEQSGSRKVIKIYSSKSRCTSLIPPPPPPAFPVAAPTPPIAPSAKMLPSPPSPPAPNTPINPKKSFEVSVARVLPPPPPPPPAPPLPEKAPRVSEVNIHLVPPAPPSHEMNETITGSNKISIQQVQPPPPPPPAPPEINIKKLIKLVEKEDYLLNINGKKSTIKVLEKINISNVVSVQVKNTDSVGNIKKVINVKTKN